MSLTRSEREELNNLSLQLWGRKYAWQKKMRKGEFKQETGVTKNGNAVTYLRWHPISLENVVDQLRATFEANQKAATEAAEKAAKAALEEANGKETTSQTTEA